MSNPWDRDQGFEGPPERNDAYQRFRAYLKMGPTRSATELARRLGVTGQAMRAMSKKYNWRERAAAYDLCHPNAERKSSYAERKNSTPRPRIKPEKIDALPPPPPPPAFSPKFVDAEVIQEVPPVLAEVPPDVISEAIQYRDSFRAIGKEMLEDASSMRQLAKAAHTDLTVLWKRRLEALRNNQYKEATILCSQIRDITPSYWKLRDSVRTYRQDAATHWGNATGISEILKRVYG